MSVSASLSPSFLYSTGNSVTGTSLPETRKNRQLDEWTIAQLNIQPYQHILEVGYGTGSTLQEAAIKLKIGFLAGTDPSIGMYRQAYRKNKRFIQQQLLQLHIGAIAELPYPAHYFHTIYSNNTAYFGRDIQQEFMRLANMLKSNGRLVMVFQPRRDLPEEKILETAEQIRTDYREAGLTNIRIELPRYPNAITVTGFKP